MRSLAAMAFALLATPALAQTAAEAVAPEEVAGIAIERFVRPEFEALSGATGALAERLEAFCAAPSEAGLAEVRAGFGTSLTAYARVEFLRFGPLVRDNRLERLLFWPDPKGIALRQVQAALADEDGSALNPKALAGKNVALQGFTALEYLLFGTGSEDLTAGPQPDYRCRFAEAVSGAILAQVSAVQAEWAEDGAGSIARRLTSPAQNDPEYRSTCEVLEELVGAMSHGLEAIRDRRLLPFLGRDGAAVKPRSAPFWRSGLTVAVVRAGIDGITDFFRLSGIGEAALPDEAWIADGVTFEAGNVTRAADVVTAPVEQALADPGQRRALDYLVILTGSLQTLIGEHLSAALGLSVGFSSLDGD